MIDAARLKEILDEYKADFTGSWWKDERYKWYAVKMFQDNWDINAEDFPTMLRTSLSETHNLLASTNNFPRRMIRHLAERSPEEVRNAFRALYDENRDVVERILEFKERADEIKEKYMNDVGSHFQDVNVVSTYLWLRYPDKYYIYKLSNVKAFAEKLNYGYTFKRGHSENNLRNFYALYDEVNDFIRTDNELIDIFKSQLNKDCYPDPEFRTLTTDIGYYAAHNKILRSVPAIITPSSTQVPNIWKISEGESRLKPFRDVFKERSVVVVDGDTRAKGTSEVSQGEYFIQNIKAGDFFYLCYGNSIQLLGRFTNNSAVPNSELGENWHERSYELIATSIDTTPYKSTSKWWTPNNNSTCIMVGDELPLFETLILKPYFNMTVDELINGKSNDTEPQYWWLNANPKIWSYSNMPVGEKQTYTLLNENGNKRRIYQNFLDAKKGDFVIGYEATPVKQIVSLCRIAEEQDGEKLWFEITEKLVTPIDYATLRSCRELDNMEFFSNLNGSLFRLTKDEYDFIMDLIREQNPISSKKDLDKYDKVDFLRDVYIDENKYDEIVAVLKHKKNIILQGAPGVGKTFAAKRLAYSIMGEKDERRIELVQFHQSYSYEDFILGYKPSEAGFELKNGIFYQFCQRAANEPDKPFFFIIDEINRGNMSKIFGELLMMIENDYRDTPTTLAYGDRTLTVPRNLYIIGMMNTADRSLAMIDYALRRRFSFIEMEPAFDSEGFKHYTATLNNDTFRLVIEKIKELNTAIAADSSLGKGFRIGHSYFCNQTADGCTKGWMRQVVNYDIMPMLEEYWFDENGKVEDWRAKFDALFT
ncbi:MAG: EVE domain-containing protein [Prevotella sp.]|nr:EVE domain-containing protein [Prevotella sp.]